MTYVVISKHIPGRPMINTMLVNSSIAEDMSLQKTDSKREFPKTHENSTNRNFKTEKERKSSKKKHNYKENDKMCRAGKLGLQIYITCDARQRKHVR